MKKKEFFVALHVLDVEQVYAQAKRILSGGYADGILLVNNGMHIRSEMHRTPNMFALTKTVKESYPDHFVGVNPLDSGLPEALHRAIECGVDGLWLDHGGVVERDGYISVAVNNEFLMKEFKGRFFGGVAFKYLSQPRDLSGVASCAARHFDVVVTSGPETGVPPDIAKLETIRAAIGDKTFAVASGISAENVSLFAPCVDVFIVGTSLQKQKNDPYRYDPKKIKAFRDALDASAEAQASP